MFKVIVCDCLGLFDPGEICMANGSGPLELEALVGASMIA